MPSKLSLPTLSRWTMNPLWLYETWWLGLPCDVIVNGSKCPLLLMRDGLSWGRAFTHKRMNQWLRMFVFDTLLPWCTQQQFIHEHTSEDTTAEGRDHRKISKWWHDDWQKCLFKKLRKKRKKKIETKKISITDIHTLMLISH